jgi:hypothetical protein
MEKLLLDGKRNANDDQSTVSADKNKPNSRKYDENYFFWVS